jgi:DNA-directed RNA polymerase alpha subunit
MPKIAPGELPKLIRNQLAYEGIHDWESLAAARPMEIWKIPYIGKDRMSLIFGELQSRGYDVSRWKDFGIPW